MQCFKWSIIIFPVIALQYCDQGICQLGAKLFAEESFLLGIDWSVYSRCNASNYQFLLFFSLPCFSFGQDYLSCVCNIVTQHCMMVNMSLVQLQLWLVKWLKQRNRNQLTNLLWPVWTNIHAGVQPLDINERLKIVITTYCCLVLKCVADNENFK